MGIVVVLIISVFLAFARLSQHDMFALVVINIFLTMASICAKALNLLLIVGLCMPPSNGISPRDISWSIAADSPKSLLAPSI